MATVTELRLVRGSWISSKISVTPDRVENLAIAVGSTGITFVAFSRQVSGIWVAHD
jgi:hypothetical protein